MKFTQVTCLLVALLLAQSGPVFSKDEDSWDLIWGDEFNADGLPDERVWSYEKGHVRNKEPQVYTERELKNVQVKNGILSISALISNENGAIKYTSGSIITFNKRSWLYGRIEVRAKLPMGRGTWPAVWLLGQNENRERWPAWGEIDMLEYYGRDPNKVYSNIHYENPTSKEKNKSAGSIEIPQDGNFHIYMMDWQADHIDFFVDGRKYHTFQVDDAGSGPDNPFRKPHYLIINFALGGKSGGAIDNDMLPQQFDVDYVRLYQRKIQ